jgi:hypothetical protein
MQSRVVDPGTMTTPSPNLRAETPLRAVVLLAGSVRSGQLSKGVDRSLLDLPVRDGTSVLSAWQAEAESLAGGLGSLPVRVVIGQSGKEPTVAATGSRAAITIEREQAELRGTGGLLHDLAQAYSPDDLLLVGNGAQVLVEPLDALARELLSVGGSVAIVAHRDGTPSGLFLVRCSVFASVGAVGFLDFKEQLLPRLAGAGHEIRVVHRDYATGHPVRTLDGYLAGLRAVHRRLKGMAAEPDPFAEDWEPTFAVVEPGAGVDASAVIHDSVVLSGAMVERNAVVVRSLVCPGAVVRAGRTVADQIVTAERAGRGA